MGGQERSPIKCLRENVTFVIDKNCDITNRAHANDIGKRAHCVEGHEIEHPKFQSSYPYLSITDVGWEGLILKIVSIASKLELQ